ncbi:hypothetical protein K0B96_15595 [Horticoccus luteus]|uniref:Uncharacterized protein n=1 Tax=Horticoccus luteus TaxID=2862869 RepID=A0A8F9TTE8_9BACT|nr:hypothetical protein [Horticoccus luteus]QYM78705.1 hypothetical protein K0B96_15595 [Horticoccus luteus]
MRSFIASCFASMLAAGVVAAPKTCEVNVNVSVTEAGRKVTPPTKAKPVFYVPLLAGWREEGPVEAGEKAPRREALVKPLARALARQGYLVMGPGTPAPTLLLVFHWGALNVDEDETEDEDGEPQKQVRNQAQMLALVGGNTFGALDLNFERDAVMQAAEEDRYFVLVSAFDYADAVKKKKTLLWRARISTPSRGVVMTDVVQALVDSGAPYFGRETKRPVWAEAPVREGRVEFGEVIEVPEKAPPSTALPAATGAKK